MHPIEEKVLAVLDTDWGFTTADVAERAQFMPGCSRSARSSAALSWLMRLEKQGLVRRMDSDRPIAWVKVTR